jgi:class 3 adenylate cyclase
MEALPTGTVTFLFTDIEGSTQLLHELGDEYAELLAACRRIQRESCAQWHGKEVDTQGDSFFASFPRAKDAVSAAVEIQKRFVENHWPQQVAVRLRMGLHTGEPFRADEGYVGMDVHRAARIGSVGHGGQVLLSETSALLTRDDLPSGVQLRFLNHHRLKDIEHQVGIYQLVIDGEVSDFPPLKTPQATPQIILRWQTLRPLILQRMIRLGVAGAFAMMVASASSIIQMQFAVPDWFHEVTETIPLIYWWIINLLIGLLWGGACGIGLGFLLSISEVVSFGKRKRWVRILFAALAGTIHAFFIIFTALQGGSWTSADAGVFIPAYLGYGVIFGIALSYMIPELDSSITHRELQLRALAGAGVNSVSGVFAVLIAYQWDYDSLYFKLDALIFLLIAFLFSVLFFFALRSTQRSS